ncbi:unnamed protein product [Leptosia nina]|uniref:Uncharacterized protein n=1 Tax=Leptosia nina TaxID=320188 RepID=A0AAV1ITZ0_9NEOP
MIITSPKALLNFQRYLNHLDRYKEAPDREHYINDDEDSTSLIASQFFNSSQGVLPFEILEDSSGGCDVSGDFNCALR